jgi:hypothetical protein
MAFVEFHPEHCETFHWPARLRFTAIRKERIAFQEVIMSKAKTTEPMQWNVTDYANLYQVDHFLSDVNRERLGLLIPVEVYVQDPLVAELARQAKNKLVAKREEWKPLNTIKVACEPDLMRGPTSARIAVVDYDADTNKLEEPVEWDSDQRRFFVKEKKEKIYLSAEHCDRPQFHQVNVWAIVQSILSMFEESTILGRSAPWAFEGNRIILVPHAGEMHNAFYDRNSKAIQFYYFTSNGKRVFTCLSHDIIAHETGHAILDGLRPLYLEDSSIQTAAFHEFTADLTAILAAFLNNELRFQAVQESQGDLEHDQIISGLAEEFGFYSDGRPYLRTAQDQRSMASVQESQSQYDWSLVLTGAMFDILKEILAIRKTKALINGKQPSLKQAFSFACNRFRRVAFQPLDYLPPVDVQFSDYARAVLRADEIVEPTDEDGYRAAMVKVFQKRGIDCTEQEPVSKLNFYAYNVDRMARSRTDAYHFLNENRRQLCIPADQDISVVDLYQTDKMAWEKGKLPREVVVQYAWREDVELKGKDYDALQGEYASLLCGGTLVLDNRGNIISWQHKAGSGKQEVGRRLRKYCEDEQAKGNQRREQLLAYLRDRLAAGAIGLQEGDRPDEIGDQPPVMVKRGTDGSLRFGITPHLRHWTQKQGG